MTNQIIDSCRLLLAAYRDGKLGYMKMPEDSNPSFTPLQAEERLAYFTLPMSLNYQRNSYKLWESALASYRDPETKTIFDVQHVSEMPVDTLRKLLMKHRVALQPNKHIQTWQAICKTVSQNWGSFSKLLAATNDDYLQLRQYVQTEHKKGFPYLSGPKIFNYWSFILREYGKIPLKNAEFIEIAPDTHVTQCSVKLGVISSEEAEKLDRDKISLRWRETLAGSGINPIDMHPPLWFWSRNNFAYKLPNGESNK